MNSKRPDATTTAPPRPRACRALVPAILMAGALLASGTAASEGPPRVLATIKPIHSLVAGVMRGVGQPALLIEGGQSPHGFALRPSHARALAKAEIVFWVGPALETSLSRVLDRQSTRIRLVRLGPNDGESGSRSGDAGTGNANAGVHRHEHDHDHAGADPHPWLDPRNAHAMVESIATVLTELDPASAGLYAANALSLGSELDALDRELARELAPIAGQPYIVFHDAYRAMEQRYGLNAVGAVRFNPEAPAGAGHVARLLRLADSGVACVFAEPQFEPALARRLAEDTGARLGVLDPVGADLRPGPLLYFDLMRANANALVRCLAGND
ncbi:MAG: zinc ABC transporter substrate-binding protein [Gammaproteobacteria bacterium]